jgi:hypothetical protein
MTRFKLLGVAAILSTVIATPVLAQDPLQAEEPGLWSFYHPGGDSGGTTAAMASVRSSGSYASAPAKHVARASAKQVARAQAAATR